MRFELFKTFWGFDGGPRDAAPLVRAAGFDGIEAPVPAGGAARDAFAQAIADEGLGFIAEITTAGSYVPERSATPADHLRDLEEKIVWGKPIEPRFFNVMAGCDAWPAATQIDFFARAVEIAAKHDVICSFETHRGRSFFNPWITRDVARAVPTLKLTCDFSHCGGWCGAAVRRRVGRDLELARLRVICMAVSAIGKVRRCRIRRRPNTRTASPRISGSGSAVDRADRQGYSVTTMTPEFGPDGYLHTLPFTNVPVADLRRSIRGWGARNGAIWLRSLPTAKGAAGDKSKRNRRPSRSLSRHLS